MFKYKIGDVVHCFREATDTRMGFDFTGEVIWGNDTGLGIEYKVSNAPSLFETIYEPCLIWEEEIIEKENV